MAGQSGPLILDHNLQPVWFNPVGVNAFAGNLQVQSYNGKPALSWWQGVVSGAGVTTSGEDVVVDQHYKHVATLKGAGGWIISEHEMIISGANAWVTAYKTVPMNLKSLGGSANGQVLDSAVQEYSLATGQLLYTWDALNPGGTPNVPLTESQTRPVPGVPWDAYHINSIQLTGNETFLVSLRDTWSAYLISRTTGQVQWTLSGNPKLSTFALPKNAQFQWQHDVQLHNGNVVSMFDDACCNISVDSKGKATVGKPSGPTRGLVLKLDLTKHTGALVSQYTAATTSTRHSSATRSCCRTATWRSAGARSRSSRRSTTRATCCSTRSGPPPTSTTGRTSRSGSGPRSSRRAAQFATMVRKPPCTRAGTEPPRSQAGESWPVRAPRA